MAAHLGMPIRLSIHCTWAFYSAERRKRRRISHSCSYKESLNVWLCDSELSCFRQFWEKGTLYFRMAIGVFHNAWAVRLRLGEWRAWFNFSSWFWICLPFLPEMSESNRPFGLFHTCRWISLHYAASVFFREWGARSSVKLSWWTYCLNSIVVFLSRT